MKKFQGRKRKSNNYQKQQKNTYLDLQNYDTCEICYGLMPKVVPDFGNQNIKGDLYVKLDKCGHRFHINCMQNYLEIGEQININVGFNSSINYKCPMDNCQQTIGIREIGVSLKVKDLEMWMKRVLYGSYFYCKIDTCKEYIEYDKRFQRNVQCPKCKIPYNPFTQQLIPKALSQDELKLITQFGYIRCYRCNYFIEKSEGCYHITCRCGAQSCYKCGGQYGNCPCQGIYMTQEEEDEDFIDDLFFLDDGF